MVKLFLKNSNLCDHNHQRHRRTDRQTTCDRNTALCAKVHRAVKIAAARGFLMRKWCAHYAAQPQRITSNVFYRFKPVVILVIYCTCKIHRLIFTKSKRLSAGVGNSLVAACSCSTAHSVSVSNILPGCDWFGEYRYYRCAVTCRQQMCTGHGRKPWTYGDVLFTWICIDPSAAEFGRRQIKG